MSTTACWATNKSFDCAWVYYGYGSRHDMMRSPGYWLSLEGLLVLAEYDYDYTPRSVDLWGRDVEDKILMGKLGIEPDEDGGCVIQPDRYSELSDEVLMKASAIHIDHPEGKEKSHAWFHLACARSGKYPNIKYKETIIHQNCSEQFSVFEWSLPSMEAIKEINPLHYEYHKNLKLREKLCKDSLDIDRKWVERWSGSLATDEQIKEMLDDWTKEAEEAYEEFKELLVEALKYKNCTIYEEGCGAP